LFGQTHHGERCLTLPPNTTVEKKCDLSTQPKVRSQRSISRAHTTSVNPVNRTFAAQDNAVQHVDVGALKDVSVREPKVYLLERNLTDTSTRKADEILHSVNADDASRPPQQTPNKKDRRVLKHELFVERMWPKHNNPFVSSINFSSFFSNFI